MEEFKKLDTYESRFTDQVWAGVSQHLEQQRKQKRTRRIFYLGASSVLLFTALVGYATLSTDSTQSAKFDSPTSHIEETIVKFNSAKVLKSNIDKVETNQTLNHSIVADQDVVNHTVGSLENAISESNETITIDKVSITTGEALLQTSLQTQDSEQEVIVSKAFDRESNSGKISHNSADQISQSKNSSSDRVGFVDHIPLNLNEIEPISPLVKLKPNTSIRSLFFKEGCNLLEASPFKTYVWSQISAFAPISQHSARNNESMDYSSVRQSTEKVLISPELGFGIGVKSKSGYFLESGFQLAYFRERLGYVDPETINVQTIITTDSTFTTSGVEVTTDTTIIQIPGSREVINYNSHRTVSIPVVLGFDKQINTSFSIGGKIGTIFNLFKESDGRILDEDMVIRDIIHNEGSSVEVYKTRLTAQILLGSQFRYHFSPRLDVYVSADVRMTAQSITLDSYDLNQRFTSPVLSAGMRYFF